PERAVSQRTEWGECRIWKQNDESVPTEGEEGKGNGWIFLSACAKIIFCDLRDYEQEKRFDMSAREEFIEIFTGKVHREGSAALLDYLENKSDFFTAPASARFHGAYAGGLCDHSLNVYHCLVDYLSRPRVQELYGLEYSEETVALVSLLHDVCKVGCYKPGTRNVKGPDGKWQAV